MSDDVIEKEEGGEDIGGVVLMLGLYLIVLAFFILLNAISEDSPDKHDLVVESVQQGFDFRDDGDNVGSDDTEEISTIPLYESISSEIEGVVSSYLALSEYEVQGDTEHVQISMDSKRFFKPGEASIIPEMILFFEDMAGAISKAPPGMEISTKVMVKVDENQKIIGKKYDALELAGRRSTLFLRALVDEGVDKKTIAAGAVLGKTRVILYFDILVKNYSKMIDEAKKLKDILAKSGDEKAPENATEKENNEIKTEQEPN